MYSLMLMRRTYSLADLVIKEAKKRDISIIFLLTGTCGRIMRRGTKRHRRGSGSDDMFKNIAQNTGGSVHETTKENIGEVMETVMEKTLPSADVIIELKTLTSRNNATVVIDSDPNVVKIAMEGISKNLMNNVQLWNTNGTKLSFSGDVKFMYMATMKLNIITLKNPTPGRYNLRLEDTEDFVIRVNITAQSELFFSSHVMEMADGLLTTMSGNPILGNEYAIMTTVYSLDNGTVDRIGVLTESGLLYPKLLELHNDNSTVNSVYLLKLKLNTSVSMIVMEGRDSRGFEFRRARNINLEPVMVELSVVHFTEEKRYDEPFNVTYTITNKGNSPIQLTTTINVTNGNLPDGRPSVHVILSPFDNFTSNFLVKGQMFSPFLKYSIAVMTNGDSKVLQRSEQTVMITTKKHPEFVQINKSSDCPLSALNTGNCSLYLWKTESILRLSGVNVTNITLSSAASLSYVSNDSTIVMAVQGDCCVPSTEIQVFDSDFYSVVKSVDFSGGYAVQSIPSKIADQEVKEPIALPLLIGGIVGGLVLVCVLIVIIVRRSNKS
ncbi:uncharacterized protein LOC134251210 [Saccostrea cucullata]|uniref:uncharacterized protein LOC134251210 n=1 Tax=Saccostrea cuccullata TaxID=36930 RepID=UPI002ED24302